MNPTPLPPTLDQATGRLQAIGLRVSHSQGGVLVEGELNQAVALMGSDPCCDIVLSADGIAPVAAILQVLEGHVLIVDIERLHWHWLTPQTPWTHEQFTLELASPATPNPNSDALLVSNPLRPPALPFARPVTLRFLTGRTAGTEWQVNRPVTFIGYSAICPIRLDSASVVSGLQAVCAYLLHLPDALWAVSWNESGIVEPIRLRHLEEWTIESVRLTAIYPTEANSPEPDPVLPSSTARESSPTEEQAQDSEPVIGTDFSNPASATREDFVPLDLSPVSVEPTPVSPDEMPTAPNSLDQRAAHEWLFERLAAGTASKPTFWAKIRAAFRMTPPS